MARKRVTNDLLSLEIEPHHNVPDSNAETSHPYYIRTDIETRDVLNTNFLKAEYAIEELQKQHKIFIDAGWTCYNTHDGQNWTYFKGGVVSAPVRVSFYINNKLAEVIKQLREAQAQKGSPDDHDTR